MSCENYYGKVFAHVAGALGIAAISAEHFDISGSLRQSFSMQILSIILNLAVSLILLFGVFWTEPGSIFQYVLFVAFAFWLGQSMHAMVSKLESRQKLKQVLILTVGIFLGMMGIGFYDKQNTLGFGMYFIAALMGLIVAQIFLIMFYSKEAHSIISFFGVVLFSLLVVYDTQVIKKNKQVCNVLLKRGIKPNFPKESLGLFLDFINLFANLSQQQS
jgi:FtsH-binding integral membrane protein